MVTSWQFRALNCFKIPTDTEGNFVTVTTDNNGQYEATVSPVPTTSLPQQVVIVEDPLPLPVSCTIKVCALVFENPDGSPCQDPGEAGFSGVDVEFTVCYGGTPNRPCYTITAVTDFDGRVCVVVPADDLYTGADATVVTVNIDNNTMPPGLFQVPGTDPTVHVINGCRGRGYTVWDINGFACPITNPNC